MHQPPEQTFGVVEAALQDIDVDQPEAAGEKSAFAGRQRIAVAIGVVAHDKSVADEVAFDCRDSPLDPRVCHWQKSDARHEQQIGVEPLGTVSLSENAKLLVESVLAHI